MNNSQPLLIVIGGPNGSGKTTLVDYLVYKGKIRSAIINPDEIAKAELGRYQHYVAAARIALERRKKALSDRVDIAFETTFSGNAEMRDIIYAKDQGYRVILYYISLKSVLDNIIRVEERRSKFGHGVLNADIVRRYSSSKVNLQKYAYLFDTIYLFDNTETTRSRVAILNSNKLSWVNTKHLMHPFYKDILSGNLH